MYINRIGEDGFKETVDEVNNDRKELKRLVKEYNTSDSSGLYYISRKPCKGWK